MSKDLMKICPKCNKDCKPLVCSSKAGAHHSEWYCERCHESYPMDVEVARYLSQQMVQQQ